MPPSTVSITPRAEHHHGYRAPQTEGNAPPAETTLARGGIQRVLLCHLAHSLSELLQLTPLIRELCEVYPGAEIDIATASPMALEIYANFPQVERIYVVSAPAVGLQLSRHVRAVAAMRRIRYDLMVDTSTVPTFSRWQPLIVKARYKLGFCAGRARAGFTHTIAIPSSPTRRAQLAVYLLRRALDDANDPVAPYPPLSISLTASERFDGEMTVNRLTRTLRTHPDDLPVLGIFAGAPRSKSFAKSWWTEFLTALERRYADFAFVELVPAHGVSMLDHRYPAYFTTDIRKLAGVISNLSIIVSADTGIMHLACATGTETVGLFSMSSIASQGPYGGRNRAIDTLGKTPRQIADQMCGPPSIVLLPGLKTSSIIRDACCNSQVDATSPQTRQGEIRKTFQSDKRTEEIRAKPSN